jgi:hypothetical protein
MILNTNQSNPSTNKKINKLVGKPYNFFQKWKLQGWQKNHFSIVEMSAGFEAYAVGLEEENSCQLELRPNGILIHFTRLYEDYTWAIPYYHLSVYKNGKTLSIYRNTDYMKIQPQDANKKSHQLIQTILKQKGALNEHNNFQQVYDYFN